MNSKNKNEVTVRAFAVAVPDIAATLRVLQGVFRFRVLRTEKRSAGPLWPRDATCVVVGYGAENDHLALHLMCDGSSPAPGTAPVVVTVSKLSAVDNTAARATSFGLTALNRTPSQSASPDKVYEITPSLHICLSLSENDSPSSPLRQPSGWLAGIQAGPRAAIESCFAPWSLAGGPAGSSGLLPSPSSAGCPNGIVIASVDSMAPFAKAHSLSPVPVALTNRTVEFVTLSGPLGIPIAVTTTYAWTATAVPCAIGLPSGSLFLSCRPFLALQHGCAVKSRPKREAICPLPTTGNVLVDAVRARLWERATEGSGKPSFTALRRIFRVADSDRNAKLSVKELSRCLDVYGLQLSGPELDATFRFFDRDNSGAITVTEFLRGVRGSMTERRRQLVLMAYAVLDRDNSGLVQFNDIASMYDTSKHPDVVIGASTVEEVLTAFMSTWDKDGDGTVTPEEFIEYYEDLSCSIDHEDYFELMIRNAWHIPGGTGQAANTANRRVLVVHTDGRQTVEMLKDDIGIKGNNITAIRKQLVRQGITCVFLRLSLRQHIVPPCDLCVLVSH